MPDKILVVDDEQNITDILTSNLDREGYECIVASDGEQALQLAEIHKPDLILLDCMLPKLNGFDVCKALRRDSKVPIVMLTARGDEIDRIIGLELGADDYISKPFSVRELLARVRAVLRRASFKEHPDLKSGAIIRIDDLEIDTKAYQVRRDGKDIGLTTREFELVCYLASRPGQVVSREELLHKVWGYEYIGDQRTVDVTIRRTREKLEPDLNHFRYIITKRRLGYYFERHGK